MKNISHLQFLPQSVSSVGILCDFLHAAEQWCLMSSLSVHVLNPLLSMFVRIQQSGLRLIKKREREREREDNSK